MNAGRTDVSTDSADKPSEAPGNRTERTAGIGSGALLGVAMGVGNALSYVFVLVLTRALGTAGFGAYSALITLGIVLVIPAGAFQVIIARRWADEEARTSGLVAAAGTGIALTGLTCLLAAPIGDIFHLDGVAATVAMSLMLLPMTLTGAFQGMLLGAERLGRLSTLYVLTAATRLLGAFVCLAIDANVTQVFVAMAIAAWLTAAYGWWACRDLAATTRRHSPSLLAEMARSNSTLAAFTALTNVDVLLVRHFLDEHTSGGYGLASTFGRAMCWGTQFIALLVVPRLSRQGSSMIWRAAALVVGIGAIAAAVVAIDADALVRLIGGTAFDGFGTLVLACIALGTLWALAQLWLFSQMADDDTTLGKVAWLAVAVELVVGWLWWHDSAEQIIGLAAGCAALVVLVGVVRTRRHAVTQLESEEDLLVTDRT